MKPTLSMSCFALILATGAAGGALGQNVPPSCQAPIAARKKLFTVAHHGYATDSGGPGGKSTYESISTPTANYIQVKSAWRTSPMTPQDMLKQMEENIKETKVYACRQLADEGVDGAPATVFSVHTENEDMKADAKIWVAKGTGLILKEEEDVDDGFQKRHLSTRYDYKKVQAPL